MKRRAAAAALLWAGSAAAGPGYNYLDISYHSATPDDERALSERSGFELTLSGPLEPQHFLHLRYRRTKDELDDGRRSALIGGLGFSSRWSPSSDWYLILSYEDHSIRDADDTGYSGEAGLRWLSGDKLELNGGGHYLLLDEAGEQVSWFGGLTLNLGQGLALVGRYEIGEQETRFSAGLRLLPQFAP